ncbi:mechanosensitive ion channel [bacterium]|nr:mechanosensitive ion channel [bacterium]
MKPLRRWKNQQITDDGQVFPGHGKISFKEEEPIRLRKEVKKLTPKYGVGPLDVFHPPNLLDAGINFAVPITENSFYTIRGNALAMNSLINQSTISQLYSTAESWVQTQILSGDNLVQIAALLLIRLIGSLIGNPLKRFLTIRLDQRGFQNALLLSFIRRLLKQLPLILSVILLWIAVQVFSEIGQTTFFMTLVLNLSAAWIVVQLAASVILDRHWSRMVGVIVWTIAALNIIGVFGSVSGFLGSTGFSIGQTKLSLSSVLQSIILAVVLLKTVNWLSNYFEQRLNSVPGLNSSTRLMLTKVTHVTMIMLVGLIVLNTVGIDFSSLAIFSGAIGVGVGFGLQKVVGNYISGLILLSDKSVKPGDVIQLADAFGYVRFMGGRYVSVVTRDEKEYLIPNEDLITQQVINWSYSNNIVRQKVEFGTSYGADPHQVISLVLDSLKHVDRILDDPKPVCLLKGFGDSSVDFELRFWINDPQNGVSNVSSEVLLNIWDVFKKHHIEIPFPQRDLHFKS